MEEKLDLILERVKSCHNHIMERSGPEYAAFCMGFQTLEEDYLLRKLKEDEMISYDNHYISLLWKGYYFEGYVKQREDKAILLQANKIANETAERNAKILAQGTVVLALGTILLVLIEVLKWYFED